MNPIITKVTQQNILTPGRQIVQGLVITYTVGPHGPFTLQTTQADLANGKALAAMKALAAQIAALPMAQGS